MCKLRLGKLSNIKHCSLKLNFIGIVSATKYIQDTTYDSIFKVSYSTLVLYIALAVQLSYSVHTGSVALLI